MPSATMYRPLSSMIEKLSSLCVRFMPTFVSPATSIWSGAPTVAIVARTRRLCQSVRCAGASGGRAQADGHVAEPAAAEDEEPHGVARGVLADGGRERVGRVDRLALDRDDDVCARYETGLLRGARRRGGHDAHPLDASGRGRLSA